MEIKRAILEAAIVGFERQEQQMVRLRSCGLNSMALRQSRGVEPRLQGTLGKAKRTMSVAARKRIADAQKARWRAFHEKQNTPANKAAPAKMAAPKRKMSPAAKAKLVANLKKARAAKAAKAKTGTA